MWIKLYFFCIKFTVWNIFGLLLENIAKQTKQNNIINTEFKSLALSWSLDQYFNQKNLFLLYDFGSKIIPLSIGSKYCSLVCKFASSTT